MEEEFPKRLFASGKEPLVGHVNSSCRIGVMQTIKSTLPAEYKDVMQNSVFAQILAIEDNCLAYSGKLIHFMLSRQLVTMKKHEIWCVFCGTPLRFSLQEFHAVTGLKCDGDSEISNVVKMKNDNGYWSTLLREKRNISMKSLIHDVLPLAKQWKPVDKIRLVYIGVIATLLVSIDEKKSIPHKYIKLVMDSKKLSDYPWGRVSFQHLVDSIFRANEKLTNPKTYLLEGFSIAIQLWAIEAIPIIGKLIGEKFEADRVVGPRCSNWKGCAKVSYDQLIELEKTFKSTVSCYSSVLFN